MTCVSFRERVEGAAEGLFVPWNDGRLRQFSDGRVTRSATELVEMQRIRRFVQQSVVCKTLYILKFLAPEVCVGLCKHSTSFLF